MNSESHEVMPGSRPVPVYMVSGLGKSGEMGIYDLVRLIAKHRTAVLLSFLLTYLLAGLYVVFAGASYKATAHLLPPQQHNIQPLVVSAQEIQRTEPVVYSTESVYSDFVDKLRSQGFRREFFAKYDLLKHYLGDNPPDDINGGRIFETRFNRSLQIKIDDDNPSFVMANFTDENREFSAQVLNEFIRLANERTINQLANDLEIQIRAEIKRVQRQLDSKLKLAERRRGDRIIRLKEALAIARALGIKEFNGSTKLLGKVQPSLSINAVDVPLYMRGADALEKEIAMLQSRESDEPFISGYRDLQERRALLEAISIDSDSLSSVTVDEAARPPFRKEGPGIILIFLVASIVGIFMAMVTVYVFRPFSGRANEMA